MKREWTQQEYDDEAREHVACYGPNYCWDEFVSEYVFGFESSKLRRPDPDALMSAIYRARGEALNERARKRAECDGTLTMDEEQEK